MPTRKKEVAPESVTNARPRRVNGDTTRQALLTAAAALWSERGIDGVTMNGVAERAGKTRGTVYHHFVDREALVQAVKSHFETVLQSLFSENFRAYGDPFDVVSGLAADSPELLRTYFRNMLDEGPRDNALVQRAVQYFQSLQARGVVREGVDPSTAALTVLSLWFAAVMSVSMVKTPKARRRQADLFKGIFRQIVYGILVLPESEASRP